MRSDKQIPASNHAHSKISTVGLVARWMLAVLACAWIAWCVAIGPLMRSQGSVIDFSWSTIVLFTAAFCVSFGLVVLLIRWSQHIRTKSHTYYSVPAIFHIVHRWTKRSKRCYYRFERCIRRVTSNWPIIWIILLIGWLWIPTTLLSAFGADINSQAREFSWAWNQWTGLQQPYVGFFSFVPMDIYPTAHYMWPDSPTYLTDQHNIVLTLIYGATAAVSRYFTHSNDTGFVFLSAVQWLFAAFCCASAANRFFNMPWATRTVPDYAHPERCCSKSNTAQDYAHPERIRSKHQVSLLATPGARIVIMLFFLCCPLVWFSTISLTKSPLFAFTFTWWFSLMYECIETRGKKIRPVTFTAMIVSCAIMLISAKYAWYILIIQVVLSIIADRKHVKTYLIALLLPTVLIHGSIAALIANGSIIGGDPIESRGVQLQMIARVAHYDPSSIPQSARDKLEPIFNLDQMADAYNPQDADPAKSSGIQSKKVSYKWRSVSKQDMAQFNKAWLEIVRAKPNIALDAFFAESYGYFDIFDSPYVPMTYYINNGYVQDSSTWIKYVNHNWRDTLAHLVTAWSSLPVLGWLIHGNFYVTLTLIIGAAEVILRRWRTLSWHIPLLMLMGVMVSAPANNFERHMLPLVFVFGFLLITFWRDSLTVSEIRKD